MKTPLALCGLFLVLIGACDCSPEPSEGCTFDSDCSSGQCVNGMCADRVDAGPGVDSGPAPDVVAPMCAPPQSACGGGCCEAEERCGNEMACCLPEELCGGTCCGDEGEVCVAEQCVLDCGESAACGDGAAAVCCGGEQVCFLGECTEPGMECSGAFDCPEGEFCEPSIGRCLPRATGQAECEYEPRTGEFELAEEWHWTGDADVLPLHDQIMSAAMVANLNDDNGDGSIDENDIPDVIFNTFRTRSPDTGGVSVYSADGVLRAINGNDGTRLWPAADPGYRTQPGLEVAIADIRPESPGPEIVGCAFVPGTTFGAARLTIFSNTGEILQRFPDIGCGRPAIADMNGDGVAEIVVNRVIVQADGSGSVSAPLTGSVSIVALYNVDDDPDLELIGINGVADHDGTVVWQEDLFAGESGYVAVADMDLDGDPDIVATSVQSHQVTIRDGGTGELLVGPLEITPTDDPSINMRVAAAMAARPDRDALTGGGAPTIANFDDDPEPEFALAGGYAYTIFENDGTRKWYLETRDQSSRATGSSVFDFEGDGVAEVLYNDEFVFRAFRGPTGEVYLDRCNTSGTLTEYPIVVDVDNDDHAEIVLVENNYARTVCDDGTASTTGVRAFGHPENQWVRTRRIWNQHSYHVTNINEDGTLPLREEANHSTPGLNNFRQNVQPGGLFDAPDLVLRDPGFSTAACSTALLLRVRVVNDGRAGAPAGVPVSFYVDGSYVGQTSTTRPLLPGAGEIVEFRFEPVVEGTAYSVVAILNDPDHEPLSGLNECRPMNNESDAIIAACPGVL
ncbi:MAG: hypothetical protein AB8H86_18625 [Polyangiales bacterium]